MNELQVPTRRVAVRVFTVHGEQLAGGLFASASPYLAEDAAEPMLAVLNDERSFLPFDPAPGEAEISTILNKAHITRVSVPLAGSVEPAESGAESCRLRLADGSVVAGHVDVDTPWSLSRLLDKLNRAGRFVRIVTGSSVELVQTSHIVRVE